MNIRDCLPDTNIILGCVRDSQVHVGQPAFQMIVSGLHDKMITLADAKFLEACDSTGSWSSIRASQPIMGFDEDGAPCFVKGGLVSPNEVAPIAPVEEVIFDKIVTDALKVTTPS